MTRVGPAGAAALVALLLAAGLARSEGPPPAEGAASEGKPEGKTEGKKGGSDLIARVGSELSFYSDSDAVTVVTPTLGAALENPISGWSLNGRYLVDAVSAASVDIVATASRAWKEVRHAGNLGGQYKLGDLGLGASGSVSSEPDYLAWSAGGTLSYDFAEKNVTALLGYGYGHDTIGRHQTPFSVYSKAVDSHVVNGGVTVIVNRSTLLALVADAIVESGDTSKPYRYIPMFRKDVAAKIQGSASIDAVNAARLPERPLEQLPVKRDRFALTARLAHRWSSATLRLEERFYQDTWGLTATSTDATLIFDLGRRVSFYPHARLHLQAPVAFWKRTYVSNFTAAGRWDVPALRTGDRELGPLRAVTGGAGMHVNIGADRDPSTWTLGFRGDAIYTSFLDDLYVTSRVSGFGAVTLDAVFE